MRAILYRANSSRKFDSQNGNLPDRAASYNLSGPPQRSAAMNTLLHVIVTVVRARAVRVPHIIQNSNSNVHTVYTSTPVWYPLYPVLTCSGMRTIPNLQLFHNLEQYDSIRAA